MYRFAQVRAGKKHAIKHRKVFKSGDTIVVNEAEMRSFADKLTPAPAHLYAATDDAMALMHRYLVRAQDVKGTGKESRITKADVIAAMTSDQLVKYEVDEKKRVESEEKSEA